MLAHNFPMSLLFSHCDYNIFFFICKLCYNYRLFFVYFSLSQCCFVKLKRIFPDSKPHTNQGLRHGNIIRIRIDIISVTVFKNNSIIRVQLIFILPFIHIDKIITDINVTDKFGQTLFNIRI